MPPPPRGPWNELHKAARDSLTDQAEVLLATRSIDVNQGDPKGVTPLIVASGTGNTRLVRILLSRGADATVITDEGVTALHFSAGRGHLAIVKMLLNAGADKDWVSTAGFGSPLHMAAEKGHWGVMRVLLEAGANPDGRKLDGRTPLFVAAQNGHVEAVREALRVKADPLLTGTNPAGFTYIALDMSAELGRSDVVRELVQQLGVEGCGGATGGVDALVAAAKSQHVEVMTILTDAGVVDTGQALVASARFGGEQSVKFLLQQREGKHPAGEGAYVNNTFGEVSASPMIGCVAGCMPWSPRIMRMLVDAGADVTMSFRLSDVKGKVWFHDTPLAFTTQCIREKKAVGGEDATEEQLHIWQAVRRLLMRVEAVHAVSWLWASDVPRIASAAVKGASRPKTTPTPLNLMLPLMRRRAVARRRVLLTTLFRHAGKPESTPPSGE